jgi:hypothetical protein
MPAIGVVVITIAVRPVIVESIAIPKPCNTLALKAKPLNFPLAFDFPGAERNSYAVIITTEIIPIPRGCDRGCGKCQNRAKRQGCEFQFVIHIPSKNISWL